MTQNNIQSTTTGKTTADYKLAKKKYNAIRERAFKSYLDLFLIVSYINNKDLSVSASMDTFKEFNYDNKQIPEALSAYQLRADKDDFHGAEIRELDKAINEWHERNDLAGFKEFFRNERFIKTDKFTELYEHDEFNRECHYCKITEEEISQLIKYRRINTKRLSTRGHKMEVDQKHPHKGYVKNNIVLSCYWCNNAKTDEFTYEEFMPIGEKLRRIWEERMKFCKTDQEIWQAVKKLEGKTILTLSSNKPNKILMVQDNGLLSDEVVIENRSTSPTREDIKTAYKKLIIQGELERKRDLKDLAGVNRQVSSIVFALIFEVVREYAEIINENGSLKIVLSIQDFR